MISVSALRKALEGLDGDIELDLTPDPMDDMSMLLYYPTDDEENYMSPEDWEELHEEDGIECRDMEIVARI